MEGGRIKPWRFSPGKISSGLLKKMAKPRLKKLGVLPGSENKSLGIWNSRWPMDMKMLSS